MSQVNKGEKGKWNGVCAPRRARKQRLASLLLGFTLILSACGGEAATSTPLPPA
jgi:hypothetical protein